MFINKAPDGTRNLCGKRIAYYRSLMDISQRELADRLQLSGLDINKNAIQRMEAGKRFVTDIELDYLSQEFNVSVAELLDSKKEP